MHHYMTCFRRLPHEVKNHGIFRHLKVQVYFHTTLMSMTRHAVPHAAWLQSGHTHDQLAALHALRMNILVDVAIIRVRQAAQMIRHNVFTLDFDGRIGFVRRAAGKIEFCGILGIVACKNYVLGAHAHIKTIRKLQSILRTVYGHLACTANVNNAQFTALQEIIYA